MPLHSFKARIYKTGINWAVDVPRKITDKMKPVKGYIRIKGKINGFAFEKSLVPVKDSPYRLFVNKIMMDGAETALGKIAAFDIRQDNMARQKPPAKQFALLTEALRKHKLEDAFAALTSSRRNDILLYLHQLKSQQTIEKNIHRVILQLKAKGKNVRIPAKM